MRERLSGNVDKALKLFAKRVLEEAGNEVVKAILFGSHAKGLARGASDVDVLVVHAGNEEKNLTQAS